LFTWAGGNETKLELKSEKRIFGFWIEKPEKQIDLKTVETFKRIFA
jgi:hypothetical protein